MKNLLLFFGIMALIFAVGLLGDFGQRKLTRLPSAIPTTPIR